MEDVALDLDVICLAEHWLRNNESIILGNFTCVSKYCRSCRARGGVAIYVKNKYVDFVRERTDIAALSAELHFEACAIEMDADGQVIIFLNIYRSNNPVSDIDVFFNRLEIALQMLVRPGAVVLVTGDFNIDKHVSNPHSRRLTYLISSFNLVYTTDDYTRVTATSKSKIDYILTNTPLNDLSARIVPFSFSDHSGILCKTNIRTDKKSEYSFCRLFSESSLIRFRQHLKCETWDTVYECADPRESLERFLNIFMLYYCECFPRKYFKKPSDKQEWMTPEIRKVKEKLMNLYKIKVNYPADMFIAKSYKLHKKYYDKLIKNVKKNNIAAEIKRSDNKQKTSWRIVNRITGNVKRGGFVSLKTENTTITEPTEIASAMNDYFRDVCMTGRADSGGTSDAILRSQNTIFLRPVTPECVYNITMSLRSSNTLDAYDISTNQLKKFIEYICYPLTHVFNNILCHGVFPRKLKMAKIIPVHKKGKRDSPSNYRPIAILPVFSKIIEKIIAQQLVDFLTLNSALAPQQHGFLKNKSTGTAMLEFLNSVLERLEMGEEVLGLFFDLSKAFDTVSHDILLDKLERYGVCGVAYDLLKSYLKERQQSVVVRRDGRDFCSEWVDLPPFSVPQGSILGPLLYVIYVNDLPKVIDEGVDVVLYADDTSAIVSSKNSEDLPQAADAVAANINKWLDDNRLQLNASKTDLLKFKRVGSTADITVRVGTSSVVPSGSVKFLGIKLDPQIKWDTHITSLANRLSSVSFQLRSLAEVCPLDTLLSVYHANFHSLMSYGIEFWGNAVDVSDILIIQKRAVRIIAGVGMRAHCRPWFIKFRIMTCASAYIFKALLFVEKNIHRYVRNSEGHSYLTRHNLLLQPPKHSTTRYEKGLFYAALRYYNALPDTFRQLTGTKSFRSQLREFFLGNPFYSIQEFFRYF